MHDLILYYSVTCCFMNDKLEKLSTAALHTLLARETRKFIVAIEYGSTASDMQEIRENIKDIQGILDRRTSVVNARQESGWDPA